MGETRKKPGRYGVISALLWGAVHGAVAWTTDRGFFQSWGAAFGGMLAGWSAASMLAWITRLGLGYKGMMISGLIVGVIVSSGAITGITYAIATLRPEEIQVNWEWLRTFFLSGASVTAAVLGILTGAVVRAKIPPE